MQMLCYDYVCKFYGYILVYVFSMQFYDDMIMYTYGCMDG